MYEFFRTSRSMQTIHITHHLLIPPFITKSGGAEGGGARWFEKRFYSNKHFTFIRSSNTLSLLLQIDLMQIAWRTKPLLITQWAPSLCNKSGKGPFWSIYSNDNECWCTQAIRWVFASIGMYKCQEYVFTENEYNARRPHTNMGTDS